MWREDDDLQRMLRESIDSYASAKHGAARVRTCRTSGLGFDRAAWSEMAALGWAGILLSEPVGGAGLELGAALPIAETFGRRLMPEPFVATAIIAASVLSRCEGARAREIASGLAEGSRLVTLAFQERPNQVESRAAACELRPAGGDFALSGTKVFVPAWSDETDLLVSCTQGGMPAVVFVGRNARGVSAAPRKMSDGSVAATILFDGGPVEKDDVLLVGAAAGEAIDLAVARGRIALSAQLEGLAAEAFDMTVEYMNGRVQFGQALSEFQALRHTMVDLHAQIEMSGASWRQAAQVLDREGLDAARLSISAAKARCSQTALEVCKAAVQHHGAFGYTEDCDVGLYLNAAIRWSSWLGNAAAHRRLAYELHRERQAVRG